MQSAGEFKVIAFVYFYFTLFVYDSYVFAAAFMEIRG